MFSMAISNNILLTNIGGWLVVKKHQLEELSDDSERDSLETRKIKTIINTFKT